MKFDAKDPETWIPKDIFLAYCGENSGKMGIFYDKAVKSKNAFSFSLNWLAILLLPAWLGYRKLWTIHLTFSILIGAISFVEFYFDFVLPSSSFTGSGVALGMMATALYFQDANIKYHKLKITIETSEEILTKMKGKGAASIPLAVVGLISSLIIIFGLACSAEYVFTGAVQF